MSSLTRAALSRSHSDPGDNHVDSPTPSTTSGWTSQHSSPSRRPRPYERSNSNFKVVVRTRPPLPREVNADRGFQNIVMVDKDEHVITISENLKAVIDDEGSLTSQAFSGPHAVHCFTFDHVYDQAADQKKVYETTARSVVDSALEGYNATIFAYGQTSTGKTYTMEGFNREGNTGDRGIIPRAIEQIFGHIQGNAGPRKRFLVRASYLQIYNEQISDLLKPERNNLAIREDKKRGVFVEGLSEWVVRSPAEIYGLMERGGAVRATGSTKMNEISSRSHAVFIIIAEQSDSIYINENGEEITTEDLQRMMPAKTARDVHAVHGLESRVKTCFKVGKLNLVDLAGSERVRLSGATGQRLEESKKINQSLSALGNVIAALTDSRGRTHIPYRDSKLTRILEDSLGGNCKTTMMAMISPALESMVESLSTLKFANRAKNIKNEARVNEDLDQKSLLRKYERELKRLRAELEERSRNVVDKRRLLELDEQRRRAEADKMAAIRALEARSLEFMKEKEEKRRLEERIQMLTSQMIRGTKGGPIQAALFGGQPDAAGGAGPVDVSDLIKEQQEKMRQEYEGKVADLERERELIEEEKAQVDRYKQLLLKQRDIMIALTQRLNERDEQILALQDELDAYDKHQKELEEKLDEKTALVIHLQRVILEADLQGNSEEAGVLTGVGDEGVAGVRLRDSTSSTHLHSSPTIVATDARPGAMQQQHLPQPHQAATSPPVPPQMLVTFRQYAPHGAPTLFVNPNGSSSSAGGGEGGGNLLSARDKITELMRITEQQKGEMEKMAKQMEDVQADKVSMEFLLREKLEKLVQDEIEARLSSSRQEGMDQQSLLLQQRVNSLKAELSKKTHESSAALQREQLLQGDLVSLRQSLGQQEQANSELRMKLAAATSATLSPAATTVSQGGTPLSSPSTAESTSAQAELAALRRRVGELESRAARSVNEINMALEKRCSTLVKERQAVQTIMEDKIKVLLQNIGSSSSMVLRDVSGGGGDAGQALRSNVTALGRLVNAFIAALRSAALEDSKVAAPTSPQPSPPHPYTVESMSPRDGNKSNNSMSATAGVSRTVAGSALSSSVANASRNDVHRVPTGKGARPPLTSASPTESPLEAWMPQGSVRR